MGGGTSGWVGSGDGADEEEKWRQTLIHLGCDRQVDTKFASDTVNTSFIILTRDQMVRRRPLCLHQGWPHFSGL